MRLLIQDQTQAFKIKSIHATDVQFWGCQEQKVKFQDQIFSEFQDIFVGFTMLKSQKMYTFLCAQISHADQYMEKWTVTIEHSTGHSMTVMKT